ncbi:MAG TPA: CBS domain-containing protein [Rhizomicrobium sp.]|jgi:CBS domain-containing protein|nr:CBS domain-containing protein [Rhizomicrobium sp.]
MSCAAIMTKAPLTISEDASVAEAAAKLIAHHYTNLPVVDAEGCYAGMFGIYDLLGLLVPRVALAGNLMANLRFISDDPEELRRKFQDIRNRRVGDVADRNAPTLDAEAPEIEAIRLFCRSHSSLPVVAKESRKVVGIVSCWDAIRALAGPPQEA